MHAAASADAERRAARDRADAERRLAEERDLSERRIRREHEDAAEIRHRDRLRENAIGLIRRVSELQPRMAALPGLTFRERMAERSDRFSLMARPTLPGPKEAGLRAAQRIPSGGHLRELAEIATVGGAQRRAGLASARPSG